MGTEQGITREEAIRLYTINGAYHTFEESIKGSIEPGKLADIIVIDRDILTCPLDDIKEAKVLRTILGGKPSTRPEPRLSSIIFGGVMGLNGRDH